MQALRIGVFLATTTLAFSQGGFNGPGTYEIANLKSGKVLDLDRNDQTTVIQFSSRQTDNQHWDIEPAGSGWFFIRNGMNGSALEAAQNRNSAPVTCRPFDRSPNQQWRIDPGKDGNALIVSRNGRTLDIPDGSDRDGLHVQLYDLNGDSNQRFLFRRIARERPDDRSRPDPSGRFWDERERMWKISGSGVCFYQQRDFGGEAVCSRAGTDVADAGRDDTFGSVQFFGRVREVEVFERRDFRGARVRITGTERDLRRINIPRAASFRVN